MIDNVINVLTYCSGSGAFSTCDTVCVLELLLTCCYMLALLRSYNCIVIPLLFCTVSTTPK